MSGKKDSRSFEKNPLSLTEIKTYFRLYYLGSGIDVKEYIKNIKLINKLKTRKIKRC